MREHAVIGAQIMSGSDSPLFTMGSEIALSHHEHWDGSGYPNGLAHQQIPLSARIVSLADAFDAISHERPYKPPWPLDKALAEIQRCSGSQFDPEIVAAFLRLDHPTLLELPALAAQTTLTVSARETQVEDLHLNAELHAAVSDAPRLIT